MDSSILKRAEKFLKEKSRRRRWAIAVTALGVVVIMSTAWILMSPARAMNGETYCGEEGHKHEDKCYESVLTCEYAADAVQAPGASQEISSVESVAVISTASGMQTASASHQHTDSCYKEEQKLICSQEESQGHTHGDGCYEVRTEKVLKCGQEESEEHTHNADCYVLNCGQEESDSHAHDDSCYAVAEQRELVCDQEEGNGHTHAADCYETVKTLTCKEETGEGTKASETSTVASVPVSTTGPAGQHVHTEACYEKKLICELEEHEHVDRCYDKPKFYCGEEVHVHTDNCLDEDGEPMCGYADFRVHTHTKECYGSKGSKVCPLEEVLLHTHTKECYKLNAETGEQQLICGKPEVKLHTHKGDCFDEQGRLVCDEWEVLEHVHDDECYLEPEEQPERKIEQIFEGDGFNVMAVYGEKADIPAKAVLKAEQITEESDAEHYAQRAAEYEEIVGEESAPMQALLKIGFYMGEKEIEPRQPVSITVQLLDENGMPEGEPITVIHFDENGAEQLEGSDARDNSTTFKMGRFSEIALGFEPKEEENDSPFYCVKGMHAHTKNCYDGEQAVCGYADFAVHTHDDQCYDKEDALVCPLPEIEEHSHTEECYEGEELICGKEEVKLHTHEGDCFDEAGYLVCEEQEVLEHVHSDECFVEPDEKETIETTQTFEGDGFIITATYGEDADIPVKAVLKVEQITAESNPEAYAAREEKYNELVGEKSPAMQALLKIGFYMGEREIQPAQPVSITVQFVDEEGLEAKGSVTIVRFGEEEAELLEANDEEYGSAAFTMEGTTEVGIGFEKASKKIQVDETVEYEDEAFKINFHIEGEVKVPVEALIEDEEAEDGAITLPTEEDSTENDVPQESEEEADTTDNVEGSSKGEVEFSVEMLDSESEKYAAIIDSYIEENGKADELLLLQVFSYYLTYDKERLDLSDCKLTAEISPTESLVAFSEEFSETSTLALGDDEESAIEENLKPEVTITAMCPQKEAVEDIANITGDSLGNSTEEPKNEAPQDTVGESKDVSAEDGEEEPENEAFQDAVEEVVINEILEATTVKKAVVEPMVVEVVVQGEEGTITITVTGETNPKFTVQYYANLNILSKTSTAGANYSTVPVIDTSGKSRPENGKGEHTTPNTNPLMHIPVVGGKLQMLPELTEVYRARACEYIKHPTINYFNALLEKPNYELVEIWVLKTSEGDKGSSEEKIDSTNRDDWDIYEYSSDLHFTNRNLSATESEETKLSMAKPGGNSGYIWIKDGAVIRLVYDVTNGNPDFDVAFYDYDISDGLVYSTREMVSYLDGGDNWRVLSAQFFNGNQINKQWITGDNANKTNFYICTNERGINSKGNYTGKGSGTKLAFGNVNTGTGLGNVKWNNNMLNQYNHSNRGAAADSYEGCTFGLVTGLVNDKIQYASGVVAPNLFNDGDANGKTSYDKGEYTLSFNREGDTYTLTGVDGTNAVNLDSFNHPVNGANKTYTHIWTNNFWPMDSAASYSSEFPEGVYHDVKFGGKETFTDDDGSRVAKHGLGYGPNTDWKQDHFLPESDDGLYHNSYFGMHYEVEFQLTPDYVGPLEYCFFGDDDMWVFLDDELVCDLGGVHSSVGEYVDLWDWGDLENFKSHEHSENCINSSEPTCGKTHTHTYDCYETNCGKHKLSFFYTERGASGSTCWMQFTLPSVTSLTPQVNTKEYADLMIEKSVTAIAGNESSDITLDEEFKFHINLEGPDGKLPDAYSYTRYGKDGNEIESNLVLYDGADFTLRGGEYIIVRYLPPNTKYTITEANKAVIVTEEKDSDGNVIKKTITEKKDSNVYHTDIKVDGTSKKTDLLDNKVIEGTVTVGNRSEVEYNNKYYLYQLPESGGSGTIIYTIAGGIMVVFGAGLMYRKKSRERRV